MQQYRKHLQSEPRKRYARSIFLLAVLHSLILDSVGRGFLVFTVSVGHTVGVGLASGLDLRLILDRDVSASGYGTLLASLLGWRCFLGRRRLLGWGLLRLLGWAGLSITVLTLSTVDVVSLLISSSLAALLGRRSLLSSWSDILLWSGILRGG